MTTRVWNLFLLSAATAALCLCGIAPSAPAEEVFYSFDFDDGVVPDVLAVVAYKSSDNATETIGCNVSGGRLHVYDTVSASCGLYLAPKELLTNVHMSAVVHDPRGNFIFSARDSGHPVEYSSYGCWLWRPPHTNGVEFFMDKVVGGKTVYRTRSGIIPDPGPYIVELDVVDRETPQGVSYVDWTARLVFNNGQDSRTFHAQDFGTLGGHERLTSGVATFGAGLGPDQRNAGWKLDVAIDDVMINGTVVPEPAGLCLLLAGTAFLVLRRRSPMGW